MAIGSWQVYELFHYFDLDLLVVDLCPSLELRVTTLQYLQDLVTFKRNDIN